MDSGETEEGTTIVAEATERKTEEDVIEKPELEKDIVAKAITEDVQVDNKVNGDNIANITEANTEAEESDGEIVDSDDDDNQPPLPRVDYEGLDDVGRPELDQLDYDEDDEVGEIKNEPESKSTNLETKLISKEMSDGEIASSDGEIKSDDENKKNRRPKQDGLPDDVEEGEMLDSEAGPPVPREPCRFFERGNCTWGERCRFIHPGINDKGRYNMFAEDKPTPPPMERPPPGAVEPQLPMPPNFFPPPPPMMMRGPPLPETAWERGLRHAKEMRKRSMQRKVEEPDFMRKREVISLNEANNVDRDMDYIAHKPLVEEIGGFDPFNALDEDDRYAVPSAEEIKKYKRFDKTPREGGRSPNGEVMRRPVSPRGHPTHPMHRDMHDRGRDRRSPHRHPGMGPSHPHDRHQPPPMSHRDHRLPPHQGPPHGRHEYRDRREGDRGRYEKDYRDRDRDHRMDQGRNGSPDDRRHSPKRRDVESRIVPVPSSGSRKSNSARGDTWSDPWARGRPGRKGRSRSGSESSGSSSSSSRSSFSSRSGSSFSSRSSSRSSLSSSYSSSASSRSPSPVKTKKLVKKKKVIPAMKGKNSPKVGKPAILNAKQSVGGKKAADLVKAKLTKPPANKSPARAVAPPVTKQPLKGKVADRGRPPVRTTAKRAPPPKKKSDTSSSDEFSHSSSSGSRSRSRSKGKDSGSDSDSGSSSSSGSDSFSSSGSSSSSDSSEEEERKPKQVKKKVTTIKSAAPPAGERKAVGKVPVPSKPGKKNVKMTIIDKPTQTRPAAATETRKRSAAAMSGPVPTKKVSAIANRRVELLEQLKEVENAILKKRAKLT